MGVRMGLYKINTKEEQRLQISNFLDQLQDVQYTSIKGSNELVYN
jgi:hypothetical protein